MVRELALASVLLVYVSDQSWAPTLHVALEIQFVVLLGEMMQKYTKTRLCSNKTLARGNGKIMAALRKEASELWYHFKTLQDFWKQPSLQPKASRSSLGVTLGLTEVQKAIDLFIADVVAGWSLDGFHLAKLVTIWSVQGWEPIKDIILSEERRPILDNMLDTENFAEGARNS